jgi:hypothetical protein
VKKVTRGRMCLWGVAREGYTDVPECLAENFAYSEQCLLIALAGPAAQERYDPAGYKQEVLPALALTTRSRERRFAS